MRILIVLCIFLIALSGCSTQSEEQIIDGMKSRTQIESFPEKYQVVEIWPLELDGEIVMYAVVYQLVEDREKGNKPRKVDQALTSRTDLVKGDEVVLTWISGGGRNMTFIF